jgi:anti-sigma B factor antagonist
VIEIQVSPDAGVTCRPDGALDSGSATELRHVISESLRPELDVVFDLRHVDYIDAEAASALVGTVRRIRAMGGTCKVCHVQPRIQWVLDVIGITGLLAGAPSAQRAEAA